MTLYFYSAIVAILAMTVYGAIEGYQTVQATEAIEKTQDHITSWVKVGEDTFKMIDFDEGIICYKLTQYAEPSMQCLSRRK